MLQKEIGQGRRKSSTGIWTDQHVPLLEAVSRHIFPLSST
jgi:hypothetical protein